MDLRKSLLWIEARPPHRYRHTRSGDVSRGALLLLSLLLVCPRWAQYALRLGSAVGRRLAWSSLEPAYRPRLPGKSVEETRSPEALRKEGLLALWGFLAPEVREEQVFGFGPHAPLPSRCDALRSCWLPGKRAKAGTRGQEVDGL